jgi:hypothetical protein
LCNIIILERIEHTCIFNWFGEGKKTLLECFSLCGIKKNPKNCWTEVFSGSYNKAIQKHIEITVKLHIATHRKVTMMQTGIM